MSTLITELTPYVAVIGTAAAIFFAHRNYVLTQSTAREPAVPTIDIRINNAPPYSTQVRWTEFVVRNVGQRTSGRLEVSVKCSWLELFDLRLHFPTENYVFQPNEEFRWKIRLPEAPTKAGCAITVTAYDPESRNSWTQREITLSGLHDESA